MARAYEHLKGLYAEIGTAFINYETYEVTYQCDAQTREHAYWLSVFKMPDPIWWGVRIGDAVHQMRAALDNLVYQLTVEHRGHKLGGTAFPILNDLSVWDEVYPTGPKAGRHTSRSGLHKLRGVSDDARAVIENLQPYHGMADMNGFGESQQTDARIRRSLFILEKLWNIDKHRVPAVVAAASFVRRLEVTEPASLPSVAVNYGWGLPFEDRTKLLFFTPHPNQEMDVKGEFQGLVLFDQSGPGDDQPVESTLAICYNDAGVALSRLESEFS